MGENVPVHSAAEDRKEKVPSPHLSQLVVLTNSGTLYGLAQRVVATESLWVRAAQHSSKPCNKRMISNYIMQLRSETAHSIIGRDHSGMAEKVMTAGFMSLRVCPGRVMQLVSYFHQSAFSF